MCHMKSVGVEVWEDRQNSMAMKLKLSSTNNMLKTSFYQRDLENNNYS
jgi:hypothetical protein